MCRISCKHAAKRRIFGFRTVAPAGSCRRARRKKKKEHLHMKKLLGIVLSAAMLLSMAACGSTATSSAAADSTADVATATDAAASDLKVGVITIGDETEGYTAAHINGIKAAAQKLGMSDSQIVWKYKVPEGAECSDAAEDLVGQGCNLVVSNSYGHQTYIVEEAEKYPDVTFVSMTGDFAALTGLDNFKNAFTNVYESRYVAGVVAGMKLQELVESGTLTPETQPNSFTADGKVKIGYVGAYNYAEVVSGYTAFFLGVQSVYPNVAMEVMYTNSWFDIDKEGAAAEALIANGSVIIGQHADSTGAPAATQKQKDAGKICYSVGYNIDMLETAPTAALTSATNVWEVYYEYLFKSMMDGENPATNWSEGYNEGAVAITDLGPEVAEGTAEKVAEVEAALKDGSLHVFDTSKFTVNGETVTTAPIDLTFYDYSTGTPVAVYQGDTEEAITDGYFSESTLRSAPYFSLRIDGITEDADPVA
jgi:basic membrane protein A